MNINKAIKKTSLSVADNAFLVSGATLVFIVTIMKIMRTLLFS